ncbi:MAG: type II toxin-antitoxin system death-on-curing family toxin, partial [Planctomycetota bacterium]
LSVEKVVRLHRSMIERYGGTEGVRDVGLLHSAIAMPQASYGGEYLHADLFEMAAAYLYHIVQNHPFLDGNKRVGAAAAIIFLAINDVTIESDEEGLVSMTLSVAAGQAGKSEIAEFFRSLVP